MNDPISRQDAIDILESHMNERRGDFFVPFHKAIEEVNHLPSAQQWISCSTPPRAHVNVICTYEDIDTGKRGTMLPCCWTGEKWEWLDGLYYEDVEDDIRIVAWMPLPEPWEGEEE